jgi:hypothetical protein
MSHRTPYLFFLIYGILIFAYSCQSTNVYPSMLSSSNHFSVLSLPDEGCLKTNQNNMYPYNQFNSYYLDSSRYVQLPSTMILTTNSQKSGTDSRAVQGLTLSFKKINQTNWRIVVSNGFNYSKKHPIISDIQYIGILSDVQYLQKGRQYPVKLTSVGISANPGVFKLSSGSLTIAMNEDGLDLNVNLQFNDPTYIGTRDEEKGFSASLKGNAKVVPKNSFSGIYDRYNLYTKANCFDSIIFPQINLDGWAGFLGYYYDRYYEEDYNSIHSFIEHKQKTAPVIDVFDKDGGEIARTDFIFSPRDQNGEYDSLYIAFSESIYIQLDYSLSPDTLTPIKYVVRPLPGTGTTDFSKAVDITSKDGALLTNDGDSSLNYNTWDGFINGVCLKDGYYELLIVPVDVPATQIQERDIFRRDNFHIDNTPPIIQEATFKEVKKLTQIDILLVDPVYTKEGVTSGRAAGIYDETMPFDAEKVKASLSITVVPKFRGTTLPDRNRFWTQQLSDITLAKSELSVTQKSEGQLSVRFSLPYNMENKNIEVRIADRVLNTAVYVLNEDWQKQPKVASTPEPTPTPDPTPEPTPTATPAPTPTPTAGPTPTPTPDPTPTATPAPTPTPTSEPTPSIEPSVEPSTDPSVEPSTEPSVEPSWGPSASASP